MRVPKKLPKYLILILLIIIFAITTGDNELIQIVTQTLSKQTLGIQDINQGIVTRVIDGDTLVINDTHTVRLIGIDAPEEKGIECYSDEATLALKNLVLNKTVTLSKDTSDTDRYDRLLRYIWIDDQFINQELVNNGFAIAKAYPPDTKYQDILQSAQSQAQAQQVGLWYHCK